MLELKDDDYLPTEQASVLVDERKIETNKVNNMPTNKNYSPTTNKIPQNRLYNEALEANSRTETKVMSNPNQIYDIDPGKKEPWNMTTKVMEKRLTVNDAINQIRPENLRVEFLVITEHKAQLKLVCYPRRDGFKWFIEKIVSENQRYLYPVLVLVAGVLNSSNVSKKDYESSFTLPKSSKKWFSNLMRSSINFSDIKESNEFRFRKIIYLTSNLYETSILAENFLSYETFKSLYDERFLQITSNIVSVSYFN